MAVKIICSRCNSDIAMVSPDKIKSLTGEEICSDCEKYYKSLRLEMEEAKEDYLKELTKMKKDIQKSYQLADAEIAKSIERCQNLYATRRAEIDDRLKRTI